MESSHHPDPESLRRILERRRRNAGIRYIPAVPCRKCGANCWERDAGDTWYCFRCGNRGYMRGTPPVFVQQPKRGAPPQ